MRNTGEEFKCKCGKVFFGPKGKLEFLKHKTKCSSKKERCDDKVVITPITHYMA